MRKTQRMRLRTKAKRIPAPTVGNGKPLGDGWPTRKGVLPRLQPLAKTRTAPIRFSPKRVKTKECTHNITHTHIYIYIDGIKRCVSDLHCFHPGKSYSYQSVTHLKFHSCRRSDCSSSTTTWTMVRILHRLRLCSSPD